MARFRACKYCGDLHQLGRWPDNCKDDPWPRSELPAPYIISDAMPGGVNGLFHHAALRKFDSKSAFRAATRAFGCVELGNEYTAATSGRSYESNDNEIEGAISDALHEHGISSDSDMGKLNYGD